MDACDLFEQDVTCCDGKIVELQAWEQCKEYPAIFKAAGTKVGGLLCFVDVVLYNVSGYKSEYF